MVPLNKVCFTTGKDGKNHFQPNRLANKTVKSSTANLRLADTLYYGQKLNHRTKLQINVWKKLLILQNADTTCGPKVLFLLFFSRLAVLNDQVNDQVIYSAVLKCLL